MGEGTSHLSVVMYRVFFGAVAVITARPARTAETARTAGPRGSARAPLPTIRTPTYRTPPTLGSALLVSAADIRR
jgi:hypothetical protein